MTIRKALPAKLALTDADDTRYVLSGLVACDTSGVPRSGVTSPVGVNLVTATATMNVSVARFQAVAVRDAGVVLLSNDGVASVLLDAAPAANSRIDVIYARQNDSSSTVSAPDANDLPVLTFAKGTAAASPVKPSIPAGSVELATVLIPSTATATNSAGVVITQTAQFTAAAGGVVPFRSRGALDGWADAQPGQLARVIGAQEVLAWAGEWVALHPFVALSKSANQTLPDSALRSVLWDVEDSDRFNMHPTPTNTDRMVAPVSGLFEASYALYLSATTGVGTAYLRKNGTEGVTGSADRRPGTAGVGTPLGRSVHVALNAGEWVQVVVQSTIAGTVVAGGASEFASSAKMRYLGPL